LNTHIFVLNYLGKYIHDYNEMYHVISL
jgi:hypothetical protein